MYLKLHDDFQTYLDQTIDSSLSLEEKKKKIKQHLLKYQTEYENMLLMFFKDETLENDNYFYITYTYHDQPIDLYKSQEMVVSFLYDLENGMQFELVVFNETYEGEETKEVFSRFTDYFS